MKRLTKEQVMLLHKELVKESGGSAEIRDEGLLDSALNAPFQTFDDATSTMPMIPATRTITSTALAQTSAVITRFHI